MNDDTAGLVLEFLTSKWLAFLVLIVGVELMAAAGVGFEDYDSFERFVYVMLLMNVMLLISIDSEVRDR